jgi:hypothetical protein
MKVHEAPPGFGFAIQHLPCQPPLRRSVQKDLEAKICMRFEAMCPNPKLAPPNFAIVVIHAWILTYDLLVCLC